MKTKSNLASKTKLQEVPQTPVFPKALHTVRTRGAELPANAKTAKRENTFSKSRDNREDRGERQIKTTHNPQTFSAR